MLKVKNYYPQEIFFLEVIRKFCYVLFFFFVFFPYVEVFPLNTDMQPYALFFGIAIFFLHDFKFTKINFLLFVVAVCSFIAFTFSLFEFNAFRSMFNYLSLFFVSHATFKVLSESDLKINEVLKWAIFVWFFVAFIQLLFYADFLTFLLSGARTTVGRGVVGLAVEPTTLGVMFLFFMLCLSHLDVRNKKLFMLLCTIGIVFMAKSSMVVLFLFLGLGIFVLTRLSFRALLLVMSLVLLVPVILSYMENSRLGYLFSLFLEDPVSLIAIDKSVSDRFYHVFFSLKGFFGNYLLPHGYSLWESYLTVQLEEYSDVIEDGWVSVGGRVMSGYGGAFFELGFFALLIPAALSYAFLQLFRYRVKLFFFYFLFVNAIMFSAIPIGFSMFGFYLGFIQWVFLKREKDDEI